MPPSCGRSRGFGDVFHFLPRASVHSSSNCVSMPCLLAVASDAGCPLGGPARPAQPRPVAGGNCPARSASSGFPRALLSLAHAFGAEEGNPGVPAFVGWASPGAGWARPPTRAAGVIVLHKAVAGCDPVCPRGHGTMCVCVCEHRRGPCDAPAQPRVSGAPEGCSPPALSAKSGGRGCPGSRVVCWTGRVPAPLAP